MSRKRKLILAGLVIALGVAVTTTHNSKQEEEIKILKEQVDNQREMLYNKNMELEDLNVKKDETNALNVTFVAMSREDFEALDTVEINEGSNTTELSADFGTSEDTDSFEARLKADAKARIAELDKSKEGA